MKDTDSLREDFEERLRAELAYGGLSWETVVSLLECDNNNDYCHSATRDYWKQYQEERN